MVSVEFWLLSRAVTLQWKRTRTLYSLSAAITKPPIGEPSIVTSVSVCLCLSVRDRVFGTVLPIFTKFFVRVIICCGSALLWRRSDTSCTYGFMDDVMFARGCS